MFTKCDISTKLVKERGLKKGFHMARIICVGAQKDLDRGYLLQGSL